MNHYQRGYFRNFKEYMSLEEASLICKLFFKEASLIYKLFFKESSLIGKLYFEEASVICKLFFENNMSHYVFKMRIRKHFALSLFLLAYVPKCLTIKEVWLLRV